MTKSLKLTPAVLTTAFITLVLITLALIAIAPGGAKAADETKNIGELQCKAVLRLGDEDRTATIAFLHGYLAGKKGQKTVDTGKLAEATDKFLDDCLDHPTDKALDVLKKYAQ